MLKIKLAVIFGGMSTEHDVSVVSGTSVLKNLNREKYDITAIYINEKGDWFKYIKPLNEIEILNIGEQPLEIEMIENPFKILKQMDVVFPVLHGLYGEDGTIQGFLELLKIPYVGCKVLGSCICMDKVYTKIVLDKAKINQAKYIYIKKKTSKEFLGETLNIISNEVSNETSNKVSNETSNNILNEMSNNNSNDEYIYVDQDLNEKIVSLNEAANIAKEKLNLPVFVKPSNSGSSVGINKAETIEQLELAIEYASKFDNKILIEENIDGREIECAVIGNDTVGASCVGEILPAEDFYTFDAKYNNSSSRTEIPAKISNQLSEEIRKIAKKAYKAVDAKGLSRVDFFVEKNTNKIYLNEINTMPGFTNISMYPKLWEKSGKSYSKLLDELIENSK